MEALHRDVLYSILSFVPIDNVIRYLYYLNKQWQEIVKSFVSEQKKHNPTYFDPQLTRLRVSNLSHWSLISSIAGIYTYIYGDPLEHCYVMSVRKYDPMNQLSWCRIHFDTSTVYIFAPTKHLKLCQSDDWYISNNFFIPLTLYSLKNYNRKFSRIHLHIISNPFTNLWSIEIGGSTREEWNKITSSSLPIPPTFFMEYSHRKQLSLSLSSILPYRCFNDPMGRVNKCKYGI